jgi:hypothetical protein
MGKRYEVTTESGAIYYLDMDRKTMKRVLPADQPKDPKVKLSKLPKDGEEHPFLESLSPIKVGSFLALSWHNRGRWMVRSSTYITDVKEFDVPPPPDQSAGDRTRTSP